jgi:hypothetical protein
MIFQKLLEKIKFSLLYFQYHLSVNMQFVRFFFAIVTIPCGRATPETALRPAVSGVACPQGRRPPAIHYLHSPRCKLLHLILEPTLEDDVLVGLCCKTETN